MSRIRIRNVNRIECGASRIQILLLITAVAVVAVGTGVLLRVIHAPPLFVSFSQAVRDLQAYDFVEISAQVAPPRALNPFTDASIRGTFEKSGTGQSWQVEGFCDAEDGSLFRIRFMPPTPGTYHYSVEYRQGWSKSTSAGTFQVTDGKRRGPLRIDPQNRWHFVWEGTGEHYFFNGTTAYWLLGWKDDRVIESSIDRLHRLKINRMRVTIAGRTARFYGDAVMSGIAWTALLTPWPGGKSLRFLHNVGRVGQHLHIPLGREFFDELGNLAIPEDIYHPGFNYSRFQVSYWQKFDRALRFARDRDMIFSLVLDMNDSQAHPAAGSADERLFIRYAIARFGAFSNITWDLGDDIDQYRDDSWAHSTGTLIKQWDPYRHLATSHPVDNLHQDRTSEWFDFTSFQEWSRTQHAFMLAQRKKQERLGRIIPQTNEEYGYEDHYPPWAQGMGSESADTMRRTAWEIVMAGGYQTSGETARRGTNVWPDTGGGWFNGRGDETMTMFGGYGHMVDFFTSFDWWKTEPHDDLVDHGNYCLAQPGELYAIYLPRGGSVNVRLSPGLYQGTWWNATTGEQTALPAVTAAGPLWTSPAMPDSSDWALLLRRTRE